MTKIYFLVGLPAAGKSTWARQMCEQDSNCIRINKDDIRAMLSQPYNSDSEKAALEIRDIIIRRFVGNKTMIIDDTNIHIKHLERIINDVLVEDYHVPIEIIFFPNDVELSLQRNKGRIGEVPEEVIRNMSTYYTPELRKQMEIMVDSYNKGN